jgi:hypothetical protein
LAAQDVPQPKET